MYHHPLSDKQQTLVNLVDQLQLPIFPEVARHHAMKLNDQQLDYLIEMYQAQIEMENEIVKMAQVKNPQAAQEIDYEYMQKNLDLEEKLLKKQKRLDEKADHALDMAELSFEHLSADLMHKFEEGCSHLDEDVKEVFGKMITFSSQN